MTNAPEPSSRSGPEATGGAGASWQWRLEDSAGAEVSVPALSNPRFPSQSDAESWVGEVWRELLEAGVDAVTLLDGGREVYGPMSLHASG